MPVALTVRDETASGRVYRELPLSLPCEKIAVRDLIRERIRYEVEAFNRSQAETVFGGLIQPEGSERVVNGAVEEYHLRAHRQVEWEPQYAKAVDGFGRGGFVILIDEKQALALDQEFTVGPETQVSFLKLSPLIAG
jgi:hypothetical protein